MNHDNPLPVSQEAREADCPSNYAVYLGEGIWWQLSPRLAGFARSGRLPVKYRPLKRAAAIRARHTDQTGGPHEHARPQAAHRHAQRRASMEERTATAASVSRHQECRTS